MTPTAFVMGLAFLSAGIVVFRMILAVLSADTGVFAMFPCIF